MHTHRRAGPRAAFTLIELLVVVGIIAVLLTLAVLISPRIGEKHRTALGGSQVQGWLFIAKQRAYRDRVPRGVRLIADPDPNAALNLRYVRTAVYIEQPDDYTAARPQTALVGTNQVVLQLPNQPGADIRNVCAAGDYVALGNSSTEVYLITADPTTVNTLNISPALSRDFFPSDRCRIIRRPRVVEGEETLKLPQGIVIDLRPTGVAQNPPVPTDLTIVFSPSGGVLQDGQLGKIILWVRDSYKDSVLEGEPTLVTVYTSTGAIAAQPVNPDLAQPYKFTLDGRATGM